MTRAALQPITPLSGMTLVIAAIAVSLASFMAVVDITIANVSIPTISGNMGVSSEIGEWAITFFAIANSICIPLTGWLSRRFGQVRLFMAAVAAFTVASILCGLAPNFQTLLAARVLQGMVSGPIVPLSQALLVAIFSPGKRSFAVAMWAMTIMAGPVAGPVLGGWLTDDYSWPWIFLVNAPVGLFVVVAVIMLFKGRDTPTLKLPIDFMGLIFLAVAVGCLQVTLDRGRILDWFSSPVISVTAILSALGFIFLVVWELGEKHPIIDLHLFSHWNFTMGTIAVAVGFGLYFSALVLIPLWLQTDRGYSATWAGLVTAPMGLFGILLAPLLGKWVQKGDARIFASLAFVAWALVAWWRSSMTTDVGAGTIALACLAQGIGIGLFLTPLVVLSLAGLPPERVAAASGLQTAIRMMSGSLMASLAQTFWDRRSRFYQNKLIDTLTPFQDRVRDAVDGLQQHGFSGNQPWAILWHQVIVQADMLSLNDFFFLSSIGFALSIAVVWLARSPKKIL
ncbi:MULTISPECIES: DHA2 family efflux MFS transporter permease subunit [unclassified Caballeronia]|uniref:DHA2 family efflux MFS transporter permease subunit n=1 Tax=unclassified Caballeronia TaxID=2646786 RepID=UPI00285CE66D|nr:MULTISPECIES: DHA2 family efflux MFS transporter permease subunit [unclassified Caballeronia]MDR5752614.1 DHA2 family efflux MFS transporter permease subunit [Caballeronia sp. LZ024]MDR5841627.1 DHA2 family efflux MFS transporter permease subunit [Caballeronia sp. LZ031]